MKYAIVTRGARCERESDSRLRQAPALVRGQLLKHGRRQNGRPDGSASRQEQCYRWAAYCFGAVPVNLRKTLVK
jgi:hypothetical protein